MSRCLRARRARKPRPPRRSHTARKSRCDCLDEEVVQADQRRPLVLSLLAGVLAAAHAPLARTSCALNGVSVRESRALRSAISVEDAMQALSTSVRRPTRPRRRRSGQAAHTRFACVLGSFHFSVFTVCSFRRRHTATWLANGHVHDVACTSSGSHQYPIMIHHNQPKGSSAVLAFDFTEAKASTVRFQFTGWRRAVCVCLGRPP